MLPLTFLATMLSVTAAAVIVNLLVRARRCATLSRMANAWGMRYVGRDPFHLAPRISDCFPLPGAADVCVVDLMYRLEPGRHRYLFTVEYTQGVLRTKSRLARVAMFSEPRDVDSLDPGGTPALVQLAPAELSLMQQYVHLWEAMGEK